MPQEPQLPLAAQELDRTGSEVKRAMFSLLVSWLQMVLLQKYQQRVKRSFVDPVRETTFQLWPDGGAAAAALLLPLVHKSLTLDAHCPSASSLLELPQVLDKKEQRLCWGVGRTLQLHFSRDCPGLG